MAVAANCNFAGRISERLGPASQLIDAATGRSISAPDLRHGIAANGAALLAAGLERGDRILIGCALSVSSALVYLGSIYAGLVAVPIEERVLVALGDELIEATGARAVWTETGLAIKRAGVRILQGDLAKQGAEAKAPARCAASDLAALMATSGSTGRPRFVKVSHGNLVANTEAIVRSQQLGANERAMVILPLNYCFGASVLHSHLYQGGSVVFDRRFMFPDKVLQSMADFSCTTFAGVPTVYNVLLRRSKLREMTFPKLKRFLQAGGALGAESVNEMRALFPSVSFYVMYGQTEATARICCLDPGSWNAKRGSVGRPLDNLLVRIVDEKGNEQAPGQIGELLVHGPSVSDGYWNDQEETEQILEAGWLHTGDLARQDEEGYIWIEGRKGTFLKMRGTRVSLAEVENRVASMPGVFECGACAVHHPEAGESLMLLVVPNEGVELDIEQIRRSLPAHWTLHSIRLVRELPKTSTGKLARIELSSWAKNCYAAG